MFALCAYIFAGLPALLFAIAMALIEKRCGADNRLINAALLGGLSGVGIGAIFGIAGIALFAATGLVVGPLVEGTVTLLKRRVLRVT